jgi:hypothetical protein
MALSFLRDFCPAPLSAPLAALRGMKKEIDFNNQQYYNIHCSASLAPAEL